MDYSEMFARRLQAALGDMKQTDLMAILAENGSPIQQARLSHYIQGRRYPDPPVLAELARALGVSADYLLGLTDEMLPVADLEEMLATAQGASPIDRIMEKLPADERAQIMAFAEYRLAEHDASKRQRNQASWEAMLNVVQRKFGDDALNEVLDSLAEQFPVFARTDEPTTRGEDRHASSG